MPTEILHAAARGLHHAVPDLLADVLHVARPMGDEHRGVLRPVPELLDGVKVLRDHDQVHDFLGAGARHRVREVQDVLPEAVGYSLPLLGDADTREIFRLCLCFSLLYQKNLLCFTFVDACQLLPLGCDTS